MKLHKVVRLAQTSHRRFRTLRLVLRDWSHPARVCRAQGLPYDGDSKETHETTVRLWHERPGHVRVENERQIGVAHGPNAWVRDRSSGDVTASSRDDWLIDDFAHFADARWLTREAIRRVSATEVAGRAGIELEVDAERGLRFWLLPGTDRYRLVLDAERGILLRAECFFEGELIAVEEALEVAFDEELPAELFEEPR